MPVQFLSAQQRATHGSYTTPLSWDELARYFHLDEADLECVLFKRGAYNRLGFALQLTTVRYLGRFPDDLCLVPSEVVTFVAKQLGLATLSQDELNPYGVLYGKGN